MWQADRKGENETMTDATYTTVHLLLEICA